MTNYLASPVLLKVPPAVNYHHHRRPQRMVTKRRSQVVATIAAPLGPPNQLAAEIPTMTTTMEKRHWAASLCDHLERAVMSWAAEENDSAGEECYLLTENFAPVEEMAPTAALPVTGTIPACLNGQFLRNGPNPRFRPVGGYHWFDGDGMIHGLNIEDGRATYAARYVRTSRLQQEERYGASKFLKVADLMGVPGYFILGLEYLRRFFGVLDGSNGMGTGNTSLVFHNNELLALHERDKPYVIKVLKNGDMQTTRIQDFGHKLNHPFTAHPKIDSVTGEMFIFTYQLLAPHVTYRVVSKDGVLGKRVSLTLRGPIMMHDFAISENYVIFLDSPLSVDPLGLRRGDFIFKFHSEKKTRLGVLPRYATNASNIRWFEISSCYITHTVNAWEEGDEVVLACCMKENFNLRPDPIFKPEKGFGLGSRLYEFRMNLKSGEVKETQLSSLCTDFPQINPEYTGRKVRYTYCAVFDEHDKVKGVAKYDLSMESSATNSHSPELKAGGNIVGLFWYGAGQIGEEAIFVPRNPGMEDGQEDDGYLISFVYNVKTKKSDVIVIDAKTMAPNLVARVQLPRRVPHGFHAHFVSQEQLRQQA